MSWPVERHLDVLIVAILGLAVLGLLWVEVPPQNEKMLGAVMAALFTALKSSHPTPPQ